MSISRFGIAAALAVSGVMMTPAMGDLTGMSYEVVGQDLIAEENGECWTVRVYLDVDPGNQLNAVAGNSNVSKTISTSNSFYQDASAGPTSLDCNSNFFQFVPDMEWDSYVTIGCLHADGFPFGSNAMNQIGMDWDPFEAGGTLFADNGTWFATPGEEQCNSANHNSEDGVKNGVLIAQLTVLGGPGSTITFEGLFQGREADGVTTWQTPAAITISAPEGPMDCNGNGVEDSIDIDNGFSQDCNNNNVPDECDIAEGSSADCDFNDVPDECQGDDCDGNGVPDSCDLADGAADCDNNGVLDICDLNNGAADCNGNSVPDSCDIAGGSSDDCDGDGTPDECETDSDGDGTIDDCEYTAYLNVTTNTVFDTALDAVMGSSSGDLIIADQDAFNGEFAVDFMGKGLYMNVDSNVNMNGSVTLGSGASLSTTYTDDMRFNGTLTGPASGNASIGGGWNNNITANSLVRVRPNTSLDMNAAVVILNGETLVMNGGSLYVSGWLTTTGSFNTMRDSSVTAGLLINDLGALVTARGTYNTTLTNVGTFKCSGDTVVTRDVNNEAGALISVNVGTMYCLGDLTNNGTIIGDFEPPPLSGRGGSEPGSGDGMNISGDYVAGESASLDFAHENWKLSVGGNFDVAISDSSSFNMWLATLRMYNSGSGISTLEAMSQDLGETFDGLDSSIADNFPLGDLVINGHVMVVDERANTESGDEIVYVNTLVVEAGATFDANGSTVWCGEIINNGTILGDVDVIDPAVPCDGDYNDDEFVNIDDLLLVLGNWGEGADDGDGDGDGDADIDDLLIVLGNWGFCE